LVAWMTRRSPYGWAYVMLAFTAGVFLVVLAWQYL